MAGYPLVEAESRSANPQKHLTADLVAWAAGTTGSLKPFLLVEVKVGDSTVSAHSSLSQLARLATVFGTEINLVFDGMWHIAAPDFSGFTDTAAAPPAPPSADAELADVGYLGRLLRHRIWSESRIVRETRVGRPMDTVESLSAMLSSIASDGTIDLTDYGLTGGAKVRVSKTAVFTAARNLVSNMLWSQRSRGEYGSSESLARAIGVLLNPVDPGKVLDPCCGVGTLLWAVLDEAQHHRVHVDIYGIEINATVASIARSLGSLSAASVDVATADGLSTAPISVRYVVAEPPLGVRLREPADLAVGISTTDGDLAFVDRCVSNLAPGGRAVIHTSRRWLWQAGAAAELRARLAARFRITALIGLPPGLFAGTSVDSTLVVIDATEPGNTLMAELGDDWEEQLAPGGAFLSAYLDVGA